MRLTVRGLAAVLLASAGQLAVADAPAPAASGNGSSGDAAISADGRFVAFASGASDLVAGDTNSVYDVFVRDRTRGSTERVSVASSGEHANARTGLSAISADGRFVVMWSEATNLVPGDTNGRTDVFVRDRLTATTERVSVASGGAQADGESVQGDISADGQIVAFASSASNLTVLGAATSGFKVFVRDRAAGSTELVGAGWTPGLSADGRYVAFAAANAGPILVHDRTLGTTENVSVATDGTALPGNGATPTLSADGRFVAFLMEELAFRSRKPTLYVRDRVLRTTQRFELAIGSNPSISAGGRFVAFTEDGVLVRDLVKGTVEPASVSSAGAPGKSSYSGSGPLSADGRFVAFFSLASNLVTPDTNGEYDVFVRDRQPGTTELVSVARTRALVARPVSMQPKRPVAGTLFTVSTRVSVADGSVPTAAVLCTARVRGRALRASAVSFRASTARCVWRLPRGSHHASLGGSISVTAAGLSARRSFAARVR